MSTEMVSNNQNTSCQIGYFSEAAFGLSKRVAKVFCMSNMVPPAYRAKGTIADDQHISAEDWKALGNCIIALNMATRMNADPLMVMQNLYIVNGNPGWSSKFLIACFNTCGRFTSIKYVQVGTPGKPDYGYKAVTTERSTGDVLEGPAVTWNMVKAEKWGNKWDSMPEVMYRYRAAAFLIRTVAPEISMGLHTQEELMEEYDMEKNDSGTYKVTATAAPSGKKPTLKDLIPKTEKHEEPAKTPEPAAQTQPKKEEPKAKKSALEDDSFTLTFELLAEMIQGAKTPAGFKGIMESAQKEIAAGTFTPEEAQELEQMMEEKEMEFETF